MLYFLYKTSAFGVHDDGMLMVTAFFDRREHLGGKHVQQKMPSDDNHPKTLVY